MAAAAALGRLPVELAAAGTIALGLALVHAASLEASREGAAARLDAALGGREHFLTLATLDAAGGAPLRAVVEDDARRLLAEGRSVPLPTAGRLPLVRSVLVAVALALAIFLLPAAFAPADPAARLEEIAGRLAASGDPADARLVHALRRAAEVVRDPSASAAEKRAAVAEAKRALEEPRRAGGSGQGEEGGEGGQGAAKSGQKGAEQAGRGDAGGQAGGQGAAQPQAGGTSQGGQGQGQGGARGEAAGELSKLEQQLGGQAAGESSGEGAGEGKPGEGEKTEGATEGGGIQGPQGAEQRRGEAGNAPQGGERPGGAGGEARGEPSQSSGGAEARDPEQAGEQAEGRRPQGGTGDAEGRSSGPPSAQPSDRPAERFYEAGEGPGGERIEDGRFVRVRIPDEGVPAAETERVEGPGRTEPVTPYGNAPLPGPGKPGDPVETQPRPLEYRDALGAVSP